jgi:hypothetical protein
MINFLFRKYLFSPYFFLAWVIWGGMHLYHGGFDSNVTSKDITIHNVEYLETTSGGFRAKQILDKYLDKDTGKTLTTSGVDAPHRISELDKKDLTISVIPPKGYKKWLRVIEISSPYKTYYKKKISDINIDNSFSVIDFCLILLVHLSYILYLYGREYQRSQSLKTNNS